MKRFAVLLAVVIPLAVLSSCYMMSSPTTGTIRLSFQGASAKAISTTPDTARVYLYSYAASGNEKNYTLWTFPKTGLTYQESSLGGTMSIEVPTGYLWKVLVSVGTDQNSGFATQWYGASGVFPVTGETSVSITTKNSPFVDSTDLLGKDLNGVRVVGPELYASSASVLYGGTAGADLSAATTDHPVMQPVSGNNQIGTGGLTIQSISNGYVNGASPTSVLFVNTNKGIVPYNEGNFDTGFSATLTASSGSPYTILQSGALKSTNPTGIAVFYQRDGGLGGILLDSDNPAPSASNKWVDFDLAANNITGKPIYDFALRTSSDGSTIYGYFASKLGAFRVDSNTFLGQSVDTSNLLQYLNFFTPSKDATIQTLALTGNTIYVGTPSGAYSGTLDESSSTTPVKNWQLVNATSGDNIVKIAASESGYVAFRSQYNLYIYDPTTGQTTAYPFYSGLPGELKSMAWDNNTLYVAGSQGLVSLSP